MEFSLLGETIRKIMLLSKASRTRNRLLRSLATSGVQAVRRPMLRAAASILYDPERITPVQGLYVPLLSKIDSDLPADLRGGYPQAQLMIFTSRTSQDEAPGRLKTCSQIGDLQHAV